MATHGASPRQDPQSPAAARPGSLSGRIAVWHRTRETPEHGATLWLGLTIGIALLAPFSHTHLQLTTSVFILATCLAVSLRWRIGWLVIIVIAAIGIWLRWAPFVSGYSDVLPVTKAAIARMLTGESPYGVGYDVSKPPGAPFSYGPVSLLWYLPFSEEPKRTEFWASVVVLVLLAARGRPIGLAFYAFSAHWIQLTTDGSNDTSAGLLLLVAVAAIPRAPLAGGVLLGVACAFKLYCAAWVPALVWYGGRRGALGFVTASLLLWGTAVVAFGLGSLIEGVRVAGRMFQSRSYWSLGWLIEWWSGHRMPATLFNALRVVLGAITAVASTRRVRSGQDVAGAGLWVFLVTLYTGYWSSHSYLGAVAPLVCWHLDDWLGLGERRVRWRFAASACAPIGANAKPSTGNG